MLGPVDVMSLGFRTDLMLRVMAGSLVVHAADHVTVRTPDNPEFWWGNFVLVGPPRTGDVRRWVELFKEEFPGAGHLAIGVDGVEGEAGDTGELERLGVSVGVNAVMTATRLQPPARPAAAQIRPLLSDGDWAQALRLRHMCDAYATGEEPGEFVVRKVTEERELCLKGHGTWFGAFVDGRLRSAGGLFGENGGLARYQTIETHPGFRRRGLASSLVYEASLWGLEELGAHTLVIVADPGYHAIGIYRTLGFAETERQVQLQRTLMTA
jgi:ribosomal protein S18 acetylase RimI-like enzyme